MSINMSKEEFLICVQLSFLNRHGIKLIGVSSDGDSRLLNAMKSVMKFGLTPESNLELLTDDFLVCVQDTIHEGTKMRNRLLNSSIVLYMGEEIVSVVHIQMLIEKVSKEVHGLVCSDILPEDRQNYGSCEKIMENRVIEALEAHVPDSKGTIMYLKLCKQITSSYLDDDLDPIERVYRIWHALYILRCWRMWLQSKENEHTLAENFISSNLFLCVEVNAHALVHLIIRLRSNEQSNLFLPKHFASQPCESVFRQMRSMGTANFTKINFSLNELLHLIARVELSNKIIHSQREIVFPRFQSKLEAKATVELPGNQHILDAMKRARIDALENSSKLGMISDEHAITRFNFSLLKGVKRIEGPSNLSSTIDSTSSLNQSVLEKLMMIPSPYECPELNESPDENASESQSTSHCENQSISEAQTNYHNERFIEVISSDGTTSLMRKSTFLWNMIENKDKLSSDRLKRVQMSSNSSASQRKKKKSDNLLYEGQILFKFKVIEVGEWVLFKTNDDSQHLTRETINVQNLEIFFGNFCLIGIVLGFKSIGDKGQSVQYKFRHAPTPISEDYKINLSVLGAWYTCDEHGLLSPIKNKSNAKLNVKMINYVGTVKAPITIRDESSKMYYKISFSELITSLREQNF